MSNPIPKGELLEGDMTKSLDSRFVNSLMLRGIMDEKGSDSIKVKIDRIEYLETLEYENKTIDKNVTLLYFHKSKKPLKLNKTNLNRLIGLLGTIGKGWHGKEIMLGLEKDRRPDLGGKKGDCVRVLNIDVQTGRAPECW